jgi:hypothetical protein
MFTVSAPPPPITQYETPVSTSSQQLRPAIYTESPNDGIYITKKGKIIVGKNSPYEISGFSIVETEGNITFELKSNLPLKGLSEPRAKAKRIGYGDLFLYYPNTTAGIRFTGKKIGIYHDVKTINNAKFHFGNKTKTDYIKRLKSAKAYDAKMLFPPDWKTHIKTGSLFSRNLNVSEIKTGNHYVIRITMPRNQLPDGQFVAYLPTECMNDYVMGTYPLTGNTQIEEEEGKVPKEVSAMMEKLNLPGAADAPKFLASNLLTPEILTGMGTLGVSVPAIAPISSLLAAMGSLWGVSSSSESVPSEYPIEQVAASPQVAESSLQISENLLTVDDSSVQAPQKLLNNLGNSLPSSGDSLIPSSKSEIPTSNTPSKAVPEPRMTGAIAIAIGLGTMFRRKSNRQRKDDDDNQE